MFGSADPNFTAIATNFIGGGAVHHDNFTDVHPSLLFEAFAAGGRCIGICVHNYSSFLSRKQRNHDCLVDFVRRCRARLQLQACVVVTQLTDLQMLPLQQKWQSEALPPLLPPLLPPQLPLQQRFLRPIRVVLVASRPST